MKRRIVALLLTLWAVSLWCVTIQAAGSTGTLTVILRSGMKPVSGGTVALRYLGEEPETELTPEEAEALAQQTGVDDAVSCVTQDGTAFFRDLKKGVYLVFQPESAVGYLRMRPFFVSVPMEKEDSPVYDIISCPKMEGDPEIPDTGDRRLFLIVLLSGFLLLWPGKRIVKNAWLA